MKNPITVVLALILLSSAIIPVFAGAPNYYAEENADRAVAEEQFTAPVSARPKEWVSTSNFGEVIYERPAGTEGTMSRESVVLEGTLLTDDLPPHAPFPAEPPSSGYESGFPWSKETVRFEITKFGEVPSVLVGNEHAKSQIPIQGEILEIWFIGSTLGHPLQEVNPDFLPNLLYDFVRYVWATYSRPGDALSVGRWQTAIGGYNPFTDGTFASCEEVYQAYGPDIDVGPYPGDFAGPYPIPSPLGDELDGSWVGCIIPDSLKVLVNSTRVGIVKVDMHVEFRAPDGTALTTAPGIFNFQLNKTFVFYKDKRYLKELKNIRVELHKDVAKWLRIQFMEVKEFDVDWSVANQFTMDTAFIQNAVKWADTNNWPYKLNVSKWPGDYSLAIVEPDESASLQHTGYWAFYPVVSNYQANFLAGTRDPWPYPDIARPGASSTSHEGLRLNGRNLVMGAWNFTMIDGDDFHFASVEGAVEDYFTDQGDNDLTFPNPASTLSSTQRESLFEFVWALDEVFNPLFTLNKIGDEFAESILDGSRDFIGYWWPFLGSGYGGPGEKESSPPRPYAGWPWWGAQRGAWGLSGCGYSVWQDLSMWVVGDTFQGAHPPSGGHYPAPFGAATADNTAAIDVARGFDRFNPCDPDSYDQGGPYRSALDTEAAVTLVPESGPISLYRWSYYLHEDAIADTYDWWQEKPVKISSLGPFTYPSHQIVFTGFASNKTFDQLIWDPSFYENYPPYLTPHFDQDPIEDKFNVWHIITFGGPVVNLVANYFNDFSSSLFLISDKTMPATWPWGNPTWIRGKFVGDRATHQLVSENVIYTPASKRVYKDYREADGSEHYYALVSVVMDHNITREYFSKTEGDLMGEGPFTLIDPFRGTYPWAAFIVAGLRAEGTRLAGTYVAHAFQNWFLLSTMNVGVGANPGGFLGDIGDAAYTNASTFGWGGATFIVLEFIDYERDGHIDVISVVEIGDDILSDKTVIPCIWYIDWQGDSAQYDALVLLFSDDDPDGDGDVGDLDGHDDYRGLVGPDGIVGFGDDVVLVVVHWDDDTHAAGDSPPAGGSVIAEGRFGRTLVGGDTLLRGGSDIAFSQKELPPNGPPDYRGFYCRPPSPTLDTTNAPTYGPFQTG